MYLVSLLQGHYVICSSPDPTHIVKGGGAFGEAILSSVDVVIKDVCGGYR
jgi:hypothetical protein